MPRALFRGKGRPPELTGDGKAPTILCMQFELTEALIDQILFAMEDQKSQHLLDTASGVVLDLLAEGGDAELSLELSTPEGGLRFIPLPEWLPADGFRLMERFSASLRNPIVREELGSALDRGRGVFRAFKDVLSAHPEVERLWFSFKKREMRREVLDWYNALREEWGLERIGEEPEDTEDLVLEDFRFREGREEDLAAAEAVMSQYYSGGRCLPPVSTLRGPGLFSIVAETARDDFAGFSLVEISEHVAQITRLGVHPHYRGLGVGEELLERTLDRLAETPVEEVLLDLPETSSDFSRVLYRHGFLVYETRFALDNRRKRSEEG